MTQEHDLVRAAMRDAVIGAADTLLPQIVQDEGHRMSLLLGVADGFLDVSLGICYSVGGTHDQLLTALKGFIDMAWPDAVARKAAGQGEGRA